MTRPVEEPAPAVVEPDEPAVADEEADVSEAIAAEDDAIVFVVEDDEEPEAEPVLELEPEAESEPEPEPAVIEPTSPVELEDDEDDLPPARPIRPRTAKAKSRGPKPKAKPTPKPKAKVTAEDKPEATSKAKPAAKAKANAKAKAKGSAKRSPARKAPVIATFGLTKRFGGLVAVDGLDLEVQQGEVFGYLGPNGAGKSTTIRMLLDFIRPSEGSYEIFGSSGGDLDVRARIGYLPGELRFDPRYTTRDMIGFWGSIRGGVDTNHVDELLERFSLDPSRQIGQLSSGNKRKVAIVLAFMHDPELYILDEPTQGLDPLLQHEFQVLIRERVAAGATVFLSSHVLPEVEALAHRVGILRSGRLVTVSDVGQLQRRARQRIDLHVAGKASVRPFEELPGVLDARRTGNLISIFVQGSVDQVLKTAAKIDVRRIVTHETDLEEVFLDLYREEEGR